MLYNDVGILLSSAVIGDVPKEYQFVEGSSSKGLLLACKILAESFGIPDGKVFLKKGLRMNIDHMASIYSMDGEDYLFSMRICMDSY